MIECLIAGKLQGQPEQRTAKTGKAYVTAKLRVAAGEETHFARITVFSETACAALLALADGDALAVAGTLKPGAWIDRDGNAKPNLDLVAQQVLTAYHLERRRKAMQPGEPEQRAPRPARQREHRAEPDFDSADDAWLNGGAP